MSDIQQIIIDTRNLDEDEELSLWVYLWRFANDVLPSETNLSCFIKKKKEEAE